MTQSLIGLFLGSCIACAATSAGAVNVTVQGTDDPWLAGMPPGSNASINDYAPGQSPLLVTGLGSFSGGYVTFTNVTGGVSNTPSCCTAIEGGAMISHLGGAQNGISDVVAPLSTLVGVFLDGSQPDSSAAPGTLNFSGAGALNFTTLNPSLKQVFFIGDGLAGLTTQQFFVPTGATRLFLGTMDGYEWNNNSGVFNLDVNYTAAVPEPETYALMLAGLGVLGFVARRRRQ